MHHLTSPVWQPVLSPLVIIAIIALIAYITIRELKRQARLGPRIGSRPVWLMLAWRSLSVSLFCIMLLNPMMPSTVNELAPTPPLSEIALVFDVSQSMCVADVNMSAATPVDERRPQSRMNAARGAWLNQEYLNTLAEAAGVTIYGLAEDVLPIDPDALAPTGASTHLRTALRSLVSQYGSDDTSNTIVLISDGRDTSPAGFDLEDAAALGARAADSGVTIHTVCLGSSERQPDITATLWCDQPFVFRGQSTTLRSTIDQVGFDNQTVQITLYQNDNPIETRTVSFTGKSGRTRLAFAVMPEAPMDEVRHAADGRPGALCAYELRVQPLAGEARTANNQAHAFVRVTDEHIRVVLFENEPYWDTRFLIGALRRDDQVDLTVVTGLGRSEQLQHFPPTAPADGVEPDRTSPASIPTSRNDLYAYDIVILGRGVDRWFGGTDGGRLLHDFVTGRGGALVLSRGLPFNLQTSAGREARLELDPISPVVWGRTLWKMAGGKLERPAQYNEPNLPMDLSALGNTDAILTALPGMLAQTVVQQERALSSIWLRSDSSPNKEPHQPQRPAALAHMSAGRGQVLAVLTDGMWQWEMLPEWYGDLNSIYDLFWQRTIRWLVGQAELLPGQSVGLSVRHLALEPGQSQEITIRTRFIDPDSFHPQLSITTPDGMTEPLSTNPVGSAGTETAEYQAVYQPESEGVYTVFLQSPSSDQPPFITRFAVYDPSIELIDTAARPDVMAALAESSGGLVLMPDNPTPVLQHLRDVAAAQRTISKLTEAWHRPWVLALLIGSLAAEWIRRRQLGLR